MKAAIAVNPAAYELAAAVPNGARAMYTYLRATGTNDRKAAVCLQAEALAADSPTYDGAHMAFEALAQGVINATTVQKARGFLDALLAAQGGTDGLSAVPETGTAPPATGDPAPRARRGRPPKSEVLPPDAGV